MKRWTSPSQRGGGETERRGDGEKAGGACAPWLGGLAVAALAFDLLAGAACASRPPEAPATAAPRETASASAASRRRPPAAQSAVSVESLDAQRRATAARMEGGEERAAPRPAPAPPAPAGPSGEAQEPAPAPPERRLGRVGEAKPAPQEREPDPGAADLEALRAAKRGEAVDGKQTPADFLEDEERLVGEAAARTILARYPVLPPDAELSRYVQRVGALLAAHSSRPGVPYRFAVIDGADINAFATPYGNVFITTGALRFLENEAELALLLAHEIAHVEKKHGLAAIIKAWPQVAKLEARGRLDALSRQFGRPLPAEEQAALEELEKRMDELSALVLKGAALPHEVEADEIGLRLISRAGYNPRVAVEVFKRFAAARGPETAAPEIFRSHPHLGERAAKARSQAAGLSGSAVLAERFREATRSLR
jgi:hypothetical protein